MATKNIINKTKFSQVTSTPTTLAVGEQAYSTVSNSLFIGDSTGTPVKIGGASDVNKLAGIESGAQVNTVTSVNTKTGAVTVTQSDVGLGNVDNPSDVNKPVSTATQTALDLKAPLANPTFTGTVSGVSKAMVGLGNVDNTSDNDKPVSTAQQTALNLKAPLESPTFTGTVSGVTKSMVGLANVDNTSDANKPVSSAQQTALNLKANLAEPTFSGNVVLGNSTPTLSLHAASKAYVDSMALGILVKDPVRAGTIGAITLSGTQSVDGVSLTIGDRVLVKNQVDATTNGIYAVAAGAWTRTTDADNTPSGDNSEVRNGMFVLIQEGSLADTQWTLSTTGSITLGVTDLTFTQFSSQATYSAGTGLTLTGSEFAIDSTVLTTSSSLDVTKFSNATASAFNGSNITALNGSNVASGTVGASYLPSGVVYDGDTLDGGTF